MFKHMFLTMDTDSINQNNYKFDNSIVSFDYKSHFLDFCSWLRSVGLEIDLFLRIDHQVKQAMGDFAALLSWCDKLPGDIHWHPHIFQDNGSYIQDISVLTDRIIDLFEMNRCHLEPMTSVRIGGCQMDNQLMATLYSLGFLADSSGLAGICRQDQTRWFDWSSIKNQPYRPSKQIINLM
jgi:hypothetical protein